METRKRFQEVYGQRSEERDYGSIENLANAHREYLKAVRAQNLINEQRREREAMHWMELFRNAVAAGSVPTNASESAHPIQPPIDSIQFEAASFLRRLLAEFIDFVLFLSFKLLVVGFLVELELIDLKQIGLDEEQDVMTFINLAQDLLPVEVVSKIFCCFLEGAFMAHGLGPVGVGQTPGKWMCGIRVISCRDVAPGDTPDQILVDGPNLISWQQSLKRSFMKNVVVNSLFPLSTAAFQVNNGRVFYDLVVKTCVVIDIN